MRENYKATFQCPTCETLVSVSLRFAGLSQPCPSCKQTLTAPEVTEYALTPFEISQDIFSIEEEGISQMSPADAPVIRAVPRNRPNPQLLGQVTHSPQYAPYKKKRKKGKQLLITCASILFLAFLYVGWKLLFESTTVGDKAANSPDDSKTNTGEAARPLSTTKIAQAEVDRKLASMAQKGKLVQKECADLLNKFLHSSTIGERFAMMETRATEADLALTDIAKPFSPAIGMQFVGQEFDPIENVIETHFDVMYERNTTPMNPLRVLLRKRADNPAKVAGDPFLDLYGRRLANYVKKAASAAKPPAAESFCAVVSAGAFCFEEDVPNREKKITLKLLAHEGNPAILQAYCGKLSKIGQMLADQSSKFRYGKPLLCTIQLQWNKVEDPTKPYLEAIAVTRLNWNP